MQRKSIPTTKATFTFAQGMQNPEDLKKKEEENLENNKATEEKKEEEKVAKEDTSQQNIMKLFGGNAPTHGENKE